MPQYKTAAQWSIANPVLLRGETGVESDTRKFKFGDGVNHWNKLEYANKAYPADIKMTDWAKMLESAYSPITNTDTLLAALQKLQVLIENGDGYVFRCYDSNSNIIGVAFGSSDGARGLRAICYHNTSNKLMICSGTVTLPAFIRMSEADQSTWLREHIEHSIPVEDIQLGTNILNGSHANWVAAKLNASSFDATDNVIYLDHTLIRGKQITYRVELKGEAAQAPQLGFEIKVHFTDNTDQWIARYFAGDIPERGTFEKAYTFSSQIQDKEIEYARLYPVFRSLGEGEVSGKLYARHEFVGVGNKLPSTWSPSVADLQVTAPVTISDFKNLPSVVTSAADGVIIPIIAPVSASNGPAGLSSAGPAYGHVQVAKTGSTKAYNFLVQMDGSGATKVYSGFLHSTAQTVSWTELGGNSGGRLRDVKYLGTSFWALISSNDTDIQAFVVDENSPEVPAEYKGEGFGFAKHYRDDVGMATVTIKLNSGSVKTFNVTFYGDGSDAYWEETGGSSGSSLPFDGPIPGYELVYSNTSAVLQLASGTEVMINFDKAIPAAQMFTSKARFMIEADIVSVSGNTLSNVVRVPIAIFKPTAAGQPVFEYMIQSIATGTNIGRVRLIITSWIREVGSTGDITGCNLIAQVNNLNPSMNYALTFPGMYVKSSGGGQ